MKIKFIRRCMDKHTLELYQEDMAKEFDDARALEIIQTGYAKEVEETKEEPLKLSEMTKKELVELAKENGVAHSGTKEEIIQRLLAL